MDAKSREYLDKILKKSPKELTKIEIAFLKARKSYVKESQLEEYKSVLTQTSEKKEPVKKKNAKKEK